MSANPFWPYDLSRPFDERSTLTTLAWDQHARMAEFARAAARAAVERPPPDDEGDSAMEATVLAAIDADQLQSLMSLLDDAEVVLGAFTEEELAVVDPPGESPLVPLPLLDLLPEGDARDQLLASALRSLLARGLVAVGEEPGQLFATGALSTVLAVRGGPNSVLIVEHVEEDDPTRVVVYGFPVATERGVEVLLMEESVAPLGHHEFVLRSVEGQGAALAEWLGAGPSAAPSGNGHAAGGRLVRARLDAALDQPRAITRLYAMRRDDDGTAGDGEFSEAELTLADGGPHGRWMVLFQEGDDRNEGILAVPVESLDLTAFFAGLLRLDLGPFNAALAAG